MIELPSQRKAQFEKAARMLNAGVAEKQIAQIFGISEDDFAKLIASPEFITVQAEVDSAEFAQRDLINRGWDGVEEKAIAVVLEHMQGVPDPDYALRAAAVANKAQRRGGAAQGQPIAVMPNMQTVIELHPNFVMKLQQNFNVQERCIKELPQKDTNMLSISGVNSLLGVQKNVSQDDTNAVAVSNALTILQNG